MEHVLIIGIAVVSSLVVLYLFAFEEPSEDGGRNGDDERPDRTQRCGVADG